VRRFWVYILECSDGSLYTGSTNEVNRRLAEHNSGRGSKYTRSRLPVVLGYLEETRNRGSALRRESEIKKLSRRGKLLLCAKSRARLRHSHNWSAVEECRNA
jgi:predicted GIY-YIG superfamily endonuclease